MGINRARHEMHSTLSGDSSYQVRGACRGRSPSVTWMFFDWDEGSTRDAVSICNTCPVKAECLTYALNLRIEEGVWGGMRSGERARFRRYWASKGRPDVRTLMSGFS